MKKNPYLLWGVLFAVGAHAQSNKPSTLNSAGGSATIGSNHYDWSIGEMTMVSTLSTANLIVTQGLLQPGDNTGNSVNNPSLQELIVIYPNPTADILFLHAPQNSLDKFSYSLLTSDGKVVLSNDLVFSSGNNGKTSINLNGLPIGYYMLMVTVNSNEGSQTKTYKIQKTH